MMMYGKDNRTSFYMVYALSAVVLTASFLLRSGLLLLISALMLITAVLLLHLGEALKGILIKRCVVEVVSGNYKISQNLHSISKSEGDLFKSVSIALLTPRPGAVMNGKPLRELLDSISERFEFSIELAQADKSKILEGLRTKMRMKEISLSRTDARAPDKSAVIKRQIDLINGDIAALSSSGNSFRFVILVKSIAASASRLDAEAISARSIDVLAGKFSAALGVDYEILQGERLLSYSGV